MDDIDVVATNLTNSKDLSKTLVAKMKARGRPLGHAQLAIDVDFDPYTERPTFDVDARLERVQLTKLNDFFRAYGFFDVEGGTLELFSELAASEGRFTGYLKPLLQDLNVLDLDEDAKSPFHKAWEGVVDVASRLFRNQPNDRFGTKVEYSGSFDNPKYSVLAVIGQALKNAFVKALPAELEDSVSLADAEGSNDESDEDDEDGKRSNAGVLGADHEEEPAE